MALEYKSTIFEVKDINKGERSAVIAFATYNNVDRTKDVLRKGSFNRSWTNKADIRLFLNHDPNLVPGKPMDFWEDDSHAYTKAFFGTHTLGEDTLKMLDEGVITDSSFGFKTVKANKIEVKGEAVRELKEIQHFETSVLTHWGANPLSKVQLVTKGLSWSTVEDLKQSIEKMEKFCHNSNASDETIIKMMDELKAMQNIISTFNDTADTLDEDPAASENVNDNEEGEDQDELLSELLLLNAKISMS